ncbi:MAG TPA: hypothetical protein DCX27_06395 [Balneola sp.]|nr:hypothetical protein [Balneola sp.]
MTKTIKTYTILFLSFSAFNNSVNAQFINLQLRIEPELSATVEQSLDFGTQVTNFGTRTIALGDINMGIFSIKAYHTQSVIITLDTPEALTSINPAIDDLIPLDLEIAFNNTGVNNASNATILENKSGFISIYDGDEEISQSEIWKEMYLYIYGSIEIGNIRNGVYTGDIILSIEYD